MRTTLTSVCAEIADRATEGAAPAGTPCALGYADAIGSWLEQADRALLGGDLGEWRHQLVGTAAACAQAVAALDAAVEAGQLDAFTAAPAASRRAA